MIASLSMHEHATLIQEYIFTYHDNDISCYNFLAQYYCMPLYISSTKRLKLRWLELRSNRAAHYGDLFLFLFAIACSVLANIVRSSLGKFEYLFKKLKKIRSLIIIFGSYLSHQRKHMTKKTPWTYCTRKNNVIIFYIV